MIKRLTAQTRRIFFGEPVLRRNGFTISFPDYLSLHSENKYIWQEHLYYFQASRNNPFIIDGGSFVGASIFYFKHLYPKAKILGFEPDPHLYKLLMQNIRKNQVKDVKIVKAGLGDKEDIVTFYPDDSDGGSFSTSGNKEPVELPLVPLSKYLTQPVDLIKLNIEGSEGCVIENIADQLSLVDQLIIEYHCFSDLPQKLHTILSLLDRAHFTYLVSDIGPFKKKQLLEQGKPYKYFNLIYAKNRNFPV